jgi:hypothetical protein
MNRPLSAACVALLAGCSGISDLCTLVGCDSVLVVRLAQTPTGPYRIEVFSRDDAPHYVFDCANPATCGEARFLDYTPDRVTIRVTTAAGTGEQTVRPAYDVDRPNGPNCEPTCKGAIVTMPLPG